MGDYQCCFCGKSIDKGGPDTGLLSYTTCCDGKESDQHTQDMFCHAACLRSAVQPRFPLYVLDLVGNQE